MRNEIFARKGYKFKSEDLNKYFKEKSWYKPNDDFKASDLGDGEKQFISVLDSLEKVKSLVVTSAFNSDNALKFIDAYVENCEKMNESVGVLKWVKSNKLVTTAFKLELEKMMKDAYKIDPELGLEIDPIFAAQDYPESGFEIESVDTTTNHLVLKGKKMGCFQSSDET